MDSSAISWWIGWVKSIYRCAANAALCCLIAACGDGIQVHLEAPVQGDPSAAAPSDEALPEIAEAPVPDQDEPTTTLEVPLAAWPIAFETSRLATIDAALFCGEALLVAGRSGDQVVIERLTRGEGTPKPSGRFAAVRKDASRLGLARVGAATVAVWIADGHLEGVLVGADADLAQLAPVRLSGEEGGQLAGDPVIASGPDGPLMCAADKLGPTCLSFDTRLSLEGVHGLAKRKSAGDPRALVALDDGFMLVLGNCKGETCARVDLTALTLDARGAPGKARDLPLVQMDRGTAFIPDGDGFVLVARRVGAGEHSAWRVTPQATRELDGRFSRVVGGFAYDGRTLLIERGHLKMRKGFPVRGFLVRPLDDAGAGGGKKQKTLREAFPDAVADLLPSAPEQTFIASDNALVFAAPTRKARLSATVVRLLGDSTEGREPQH